MPLRDPVLEARVQTLGKQLRCAVCQGMSIADSPAAMAKSQLDTVRRLVSEGKTDQEVLDYFVERYDEWVLLDPRPKGFATLVWLGPSVALLAGFVFVLWFVRSRNSLPAPVPQAPAASPNDEDPYVKAVREELKK
jgi:cytochrome c-type biogenesis protein CcmH